MFITEVRIKLGSGANPMAFARIEFDRMFVLNDLKLISGKTGCFVSMPSRRKTIRCHGCGTKNHLRANYCNNCGIKLRPLVERSEKSSLYSDIGHPITKECRAAINDAVYQAYLREVERSKHPGYVCQYAPDQED